jgi:hypothetical protein
MRCCRRRESTREGDAWKSRGEFEVASAKNLVKVAGRLVLEGRALDWRCFSGRKRVSKTTFTAVGEEGVLDEAKTSRAAPEAFDAREAGEAGSEVPVRSFQGF